MRLEQGGRVLDHVRPERQLPRHVQLPRVDEQPNVGCLGQLGMLGAGRHLDVRQPRVRVLRVIHRVLAALGDRELEVELDRRVR